MTLGGAGNRLLNLDEKEIISLYNKFGVIYKVAKEVGCSHSSIKYILEKHNIKIKTDKEHAKERGFSVDRYSLDNEFLEHYQTLHEAAIWIKENNENAKNRNSINISYLLKNNICREASFFGYIWKSNEITEDIKLESLKKLKEIKKDICPVCGINKKDKKSSSCYDCYLKNIRKDKKVNKTNKNQSCSKRSVKNSNKNNKEKFLEELNKKISKQILMQLVREKSFLEIGKIYNISDNTVRRWCKKYCIPFRKEDIVEISNEDWETECNLSKEEYEAKYINTKKEKDIITDQDIIDKYLELKNLSALEKLFHKDAKTIKKILLKNGIDLSDTTKKNVLKVQKLDSDSLDILEEFCTVNDAINYILNNNLANSKDKNTIRKALQDSNIRNRKAYGYLWRYIYEENN